MILRQNSVCLNVGAEAPDFELPDFEIPDISLPDIDLGGIFDAF